MTRSRTILSLGLLAALACGGCQGGGTPARPSDNRAVEARKLSATDPCADRLHDLCGSILSYYMVNRRLPAQLEDLRRLSPELPSPLACPVSNEPYAYDPAGIPLQDPPGRILVYDPSPSHHGVRWAILAETRESGPPILKTIALTEAKFNQAKTAQ